MPAVRALRKNPGFAAVAIVSLALGIGANTAVFTLINALMLRSLPVSHPEELLQVTMGKQAQWFSNPIFEQIRDRQDVFSGIFAYGRWRFNLARGGEARYVQGHYVSGPFFETLGIGAALGRVLTPADDKRGCAGTAVLSYNLWQSEYAGSRDIVGKTISLNSHPFRIVGVAEPGFTGFDVGSSVGVLVPVCTESILHLHPDHILEMNSLPGSKGIYGWLKIIGRLKPAVSARQATARLKTLAPEIFGANLGRTLETEPTANGQSDLRNEYRRPLMIIIAVTAIVLLIACANVANLLLARGVAREREIAIRMALGCGRVRLVRELLTESLLLSCIGAILGALFAQWSVQMLVKFLGVFLDLRPDDTVLAFTAGVAILTGLLFGIAPAWRGTQVRLRERSHVSGGAFFSLRNVLVMAQVSLALLLMIGAALMISTFWKLVSVDPGFQPGNVLLTRVDFRNGNPARERRVWEMLQKLREVPGVHSASISSTKPLCGCERSDEVRVDGAAAQVLLEEVSEGFFETLGTRIVAGRDFESFDTTTSPRVAIINQSMSKRLFGAINPLDRHLRRNGESVEIIGVVNDAKFGSLREESSPILYTARRQDPWSDLYYEFEVRTAGEPTAFIASVKAAVGQVDRDAALEFSTLATRVRKSLEREQLLAALAGCFGALALLLTSIGLYGIVSYNVARRRNEIGIRMALGAEPARVLQMVMGEVALLAGIGLLIGLGAAMATTRFVASLLYGMTPNDPVAFSIGIALLAAVASVAGFVQARRASRLDPLAALREE